MLQNIFCAAHLTKKYQMKLLVMTILLVTYGTTLNLTAQIVAPKFGNGLRITAQDSSFTMKIGMRFQTLFLGENDLVDDDFGQATDTQARIFIRRARLKFDGYIFSPKLKYKTELALSNRDNGGGNSSTFSNAANIILDAYIEWNFYKNLSLRVGQTKLPSNRERVISSGNLQFVDRSRLNSRFTLDRDVGLILRHHHKLGETFILKEAIAFSSGEGKNITSGNIGGSALTFQLEALPFGKFQSKGDYIGSAIKRETTPKLAIQLVYDINRDAGRERGRGGSFIVNPTGDFIGRNLTNFHADFIFKYQGLSFMAEYANTSADGGPVVRNEEDNIIGTYYTGSGVNLNLGYMFDSNWELAVRWTDIRPDEEVANDEMQYTLGLNKFIVGHKLKVQGDITYRSIDNSDDELFYRLQMDVHF